MPIFKTKPTANPRKLREIDMSNHDYPSVFDAPEEATDLMVVSPSFEEEKTDFIERLESEPGRGRDASKDGSLLAFLFRLN